MPKLFILLIISGFLLFFSMPVQATIGPEPSAGAGTDMIAPSVPTNVQLSRQGAKVIITWTDPTESDFYKIEFLRNDGNGTPVTGDARGMILKGVERYEDTDSLAGQEYVYRLRISDLRSNTRLSDEYTTVAPVVESAPAPAPVATLPTTATSTTVTAVAPTAQEVSAKALLSADVAEFKIILTATQEVPIINFLIQGISAETIKLGAGERRALLRDYFETVGRGDVDWGDVQRMAKGEKPTARNLAKEQAQLPLVLIMWNKMMGHNPNFKDQVEDLAWNTMMYRMRFTRDLAKEQEGINKFKTILKRIPASPLDWAGVRALGYVLK